MRLAFIDFSDKFVCTLVFPADKLKFQTLPPSDASSKEANGAERRHLRRLPSTQRQATSLPTHVRTRTPTLSQLPASSLHDTATRRLSFCAESSNSFQEKKKETTANVVLWFFAFFVFNQISRGARAAGRGEGAVAGKCVSAGEQAGRQQNTVQHARPPHTPPPPARLYYALTIHDHDHEGGMRGERCTGGKQAEQHTRHTAHVHA